MADDRPALVVAALEERGLWLATAESLTAGLVAATLGDVPGCSRVLRGGVIAYQPDVKAELLGLSAETLSSGIVSRPVAEAMALAAGRLLRADVGVGTTGVAGPDPHEGEPVGSVWIAVSAPSGVVARHLVLGGGREAIRSQTVAACWDLLLEMLQDSP